MRRDGAEVHLTPTEYTLLAALIREAGRVVTLKDRLGRIGFGTTNDTAEKGRGANKTPAHTEVQAGEQLPEWARRDSNARPLAPEASALSS